MIFRRNELKWNRPVKTDGTPTDPNALTIAIHTDVALTLLLFVLNSWFAKVNSSQD